MKGPPRTPDELEDHRQDVQDYFDRAGSVALVCEIHWAEGNRFTELADAMGVSTSTVSRRLQEAVDLKILELTLESTEYGTNRVYQLTKAGQHIRQIFDRTGTKDAYIRLQAIEQELSDAVDRAQTQISENMYQ